MPKILGLITSVEVGIGTGGLNLNVIAEGKRRGKNYFVPLNLDSVPLRVKSVGQEEQDVNGHELLHWLSEFSQVPTEYTCELLTDSEGRVTQARFWKGV